MESTEHENNKWKTRNRLDELKEDFSRFANIFTGKKENEYNWEDHGIPLINKNKYSYTKEERKVLKYLMFKEMPSELRVQVSL